MKGKVEMKEGTLIFTFTEIPNEFLEVVAEKLKTLLPQAVFEANQKFIDQEVKRMIEGTSEIKKPEGLHKRRNGTDKGIFKVRN